LGRAKRVLLAISIGFNFVQIVPFDHALKRAAVDAEDACGGLFVAACVFEHMMNMATFDL
jgi:hypothetical protein